MHTRIHHFSGLLLAVVLFGITSISTAREIAGVNIPEQVELSAGGDKLLLNGAGIRSKFFVKVYVGALYLPAKETAADKIIAAATARRVSMHVLYDEVSKEKLTGGWTDGFENNHSREEFEKLKPRLEQFNQLFTAVRRGDVVFIDYLPAQGIRVTINGEIKGSVAGEDFARAVFKVWLGEHPADDALKQGMLGHE